MFLRAKVARFAVLLLLAAICMHPRASAQAQSASPYDLVNAVNELRALHGLQPYTIDPGIMAYAQEHSEYQAATKTSTHIHSDGLNPLSKGLEENVASGTASVFTVSVAVYEVWADWGHRHILTGYADGEIGAGVAYSDDGFVYYTVNIRPGEELATTVAPSVALQTAAPGPDGSITHVVGYGQTLWSIAVSYGVTVDEIRRLNNLPADSNVIQTGQKLLIRAAGAEATLQPAQTAAQLTPPPIASAAQITATPFSTSTAVPSSSLPPAPTRTPTEAASRRTSTGVFIALGIGIIGLTIAAIFGFRQAHEDGE
jgi:LysM repeat protein